MKKLLVFLIILASSAAATAKSVELETDVFLEAGYRKDHLKWSVSSQPGANIIIKEKWKNLEVLQYSGRADFYFCERFYLSGTANYGKLMNGRKSYDEIDLDEIVSFDEDGWLKAHTKGHVYDFSCGSGYLFPFFCDRMRAIPLIGYSYHFQKFIDSDYTDSVFLLNLFEDVTSSYSYRWKGHWIGFNCSYHFENDFKAAFEYQYHWLSYHGSIKDNFIENSEEIQKNHHVHGHAIALKMISPCWNNFALSLEGNYKFSSGKNGTNEIEGEIFDLKKISWGSANIQLAILISF
jgi:hypothetical protein